MSLTPPGGVAAGHDYGWSGSVIELLEIIGPLTDPTAYGGGASDAFDLVLPSLPGYGLPGASAWSAGSCVPSCCGRAGPDEPGRATGGD